VNATAQSPYLSYVAHSKESSRAGRLALVSASPLFSGLSLNECSEIASCSEARYFGNNELLFMQGQPSLHLMVVQTGSIKLTQLSPCGLEVILWVAAMGESVALPTGSLICEHTCSARAMTDCTVLVWHSKRLECLLERFPQFGRNIGFILSDRLKSLEERFREVATEKVPQRLAFSLLRLVKQIGKQAFGGTEVSLSREELAQMTGTTPFTVSRLLSKWGEERIVLSRREAVVILDIQHLKRLREMKS
jgi:CRP-like cAMP-binding protein